MQTHADADVLLSGLKDHPGIFVVCVQYDEPPKQVDVVEFPTANIGHHFELSIELYYI